MRIAFLVKRHYTGQDLIRSGFGRYGQLPRELARAGHAVAVLALDYRGERRPATASHGGVIFRSFPATPLVPPTRAVKEAIRGYAPDIVIAGGHCNFGTYARRAIRNSHTKIVFDLYDYYPAFFPFALRPLGKWFWDRSLRASDAVITASPALANAVAGFTRGKPGLLIRNGFDPHLFTPVDRMVARREMFPSISPEERLVGYFGGITSQVAMKEVLTALDQLEAGERIRTRLIHAGTPPCENDVPRYTALGQLAQAGVVRAMGACDVVLAPYRNTLQVRYSNACKLSEYAALGAVVVASQNGDWQAVIPPGHPGLFAPGNADSLLNALRAQLLDPQPLNPNPELTWSRQGAFLADWLEQR